MAGDSVCAGLQALRVNPQSQTPSHGDLYRCSRLLEHILVQVKGRVEHR